ncbi:hypothetical protein ThrDRAFT_01461 [Frankia casuarinae]|uniref:DUF881 domain-containing protein n=1 Tax=Frankia casuarinae (strain DSM 45818 / CECT 9043 / HFP020203 / CcI3) TaxID=106370 RepID=Q2JD01_FRACC|nr:protein of unknown function DUF881 [Frankia casuarinae]EYT92885.1 hypothetical protein ThrDRAFT_01461 [Frankia casuarinae]
MPNVRERTGWPRRGPVCPGAAGPSDPCGVSGRPRRPWQRPLALALVLGLLGLVIATGARRAATTAGERAELVAALRAKIHERSAVTTAAATRVGELRLRVKTAREQRARAERELAWATAALSDLGPAAGWSPVRGPGARIELADRTAPGPSAPSAPSAPRASTAPTPLRPLTGLAGPHPAPASGWTRIQDRDLADLVNVLWISGAEAVAVNGVRLTALSAIRAAGDLILVGFVPMIAPYTVEAVGDPDDLVRRLEESAVIDRLRHRPDSPVTSLSVVTVRNLTLPAAYPQVLRHARRSES